MKAVCCESKVGVYEKALLGQLLLLHMVTVGVVAAGW